MLYLEKLLLLVSNGEVSNGDLTRRKCSQTCLYVTFQGNIEIGSHKTGGRLIQVY